VVEELADGLQETYRRHLGLGMAPDAAAQTAVAEYRARRSYGTGQPISAARLASAWGRTR